jgi:RNA polymerase sigma-70 factor (ECF subfamily)
MSTVCQVVYLAFTTGYAPATGRQTTRVEVADEAIRLARLLRTLMPQRTELVPLLALMLLQHARRDTRTGPDGHLVLLPDQDRAAWHHEEIDEALRLLEPMMTSSWTGTTAEYFLQALIAAEHAVAPTAVDTRWDRIAGHYAELEALTGSPVVRLNRAVAVAEAEGAAAGLAIADQLELDEYHYLHSTRGELLRRLGRLDEARAAYGRALELVHDDAERRLLERKVVELGPGS